MYKVFQLLFELATGVSFITIDNLALLLSDVTFNQSTGNLGSGSGYFRYSLSLIVLMLPAFRLPQQ
ncbi:hypothetical protein [Pedobacter alluvionis]|uniref:Uncharacterized protein n=1 Tax=Pedobacter alluvionis TaxID=475253 RepID=A0ABY2HNI4_9SPHI|nr:hypothetical protein [Pedobacter alluvionis]TFB31046.1 hypothetical protein E3V97_10530 [Pedobacter alluvionis]